MTFIIAYFFFNFAKRFNNLPIEQFEQYPSLSNGSKQYLHFFIYKLLILSL